MPDFIDLTFRGTARVIATAVLGGRDGVTLVDPGPTSCLPALETGLRDRGYTLRDVRTILLTHIHLDHAGAAGTIVDRVPAAQVYVHERGAPHLIDPSKLLASAARLFGDQMDALWGAFLSVPADRVRPLAGGERIAVGGITLHVAYTPGHAVHHVSYFDEQSGVAYVGDAAGIRVSGDYLLAPTPPPDIDINAWSRSLDTIEAWQPVSLFLTHFGPVTPSRSHLSQFRSALVTTAEAVRESLVAPGSDEDRRRAFAVRLRRELRRNMQEHEAAAAELAAPFEQLWQGLARYWRRKP